MHYSWPVENYLDEERIWGKRNVITVIYMKYSYENTRFCQVLCFGYVATKIFRRCNFITILNFQPLSILDGEQTLLTT